MAGRARSTKKPKPTERAGRPRGSRRHLSPVQLRGIQDRLRALLQARNWTHESLAEALGVAKSAVSYWLHPKKPAMPQAAQLVALAEKAQVSLDWLLLGVGSEGLHETRPRAELGADLRHYVESRLPRSVPVAPGDFTRIPGPPVAEFLPRSDEELISRAASLLTDEALAVRIRVMRMGLRSLRSQKSDNRISPTPEES